MKKLLHKIKSIYKKIDFENLRTQIGISVLFGVLFGLIMGYYTYIQSKYRHRTDGAKKEMIKNIKVSKNYYKQFPESDNIVKTYNYNYTAAVTVSLATMSLFLIFKPRSK